MPELRGSKYDDARFVSSVKSTWRSLHLINTLITDDGILKAIEKLDNLTEIAIESDFITDRSVCALCQLPNLISLILHRAPKVTDYSATAIEQCTQLRELYLNSTQISDIGLEKLQNLQELWSLQLNDTSITDSGVCFLTSLKSLTNLGLSRTNVKGCSLTLLSDFPLSKEDYGLYLYLDHCPVSDSTIRPYLEMRPRVRLLSLSSTQISDKTLAFVSNFERLENLRVDGTNVTDEGVGHFYGHPVLCRLYVRQTKVTSSAVHTLKKSIATSGRTLSVYSDHK